MVVQIVVLASNGESRTVKPLTLSHDVKPTGASIAKVCRKTKPAKEIGTYTWKGRVLTLWGWSEGKAGTENKHEMPPPHDEVLLFGDSVIVASMDDMLVDFTNERYLEFYHDAFKGFEDIDGEEEEEEEEEEDADQDSFLEEDVADDVVEDVADDVAEDVADAEEDVDAEEDAEEAEEAEEAEAEAEAEDVEDIDGDCYDDGEDGGGGKRRAPRRRTAQTPDNRRIDMGLRSRIKIPSPLGKRAPKWQSAPELESEDYSTKLTLSS